MNHETNVARTRKSVDARIGFRIHLAVFLIVNALLLVINLTTSSDRLWFQWPLLGWGLGLLAHAGAAFWLPGVRERMIEKEAGAGS